MITDEEITSFQELYKKHFGKEISREVALEKGIKLQRLVSLVYQPMTEAELKLVQERLKTISELENN